MFKRGKSKEEGIYNRVQVLEPIQSSIYLDGTGGVVMVTAMLGVRPTLHQVSSRGSELNACARRPRCLCI